MELYRTILTFLTSITITTPASAQTTVRRVSCHDPSVFIDSISAGFSAENPRIYIYGSHLGRGYTTESSNYAYWNSFLKGENYQDINKSLFADTNGTRVWFDQAYNTHVVTQVKNCNGEEVTFGNFNAHSWQYTGYVIKGNEWAPDVIWNKTMKKWCMYMTINGDNWCSSIVCLTSTHPQGPWIYQGPVIFSGFTGTSAHVGFEATDDWTQTDYAIATGESALPQRYKVGNNWGSYWPNCIDPCVFYDDDDNLWMTYGSWSGGIWVIRLNPENGLRDYTYHFTYEINGVTRTPGYATSDCTSDPYFGKKIAGGYYVSGEGSYIEKIGRYYFLFVSYGNLDADPNNTSSYHGYQMRVFRSENATGPFTDPYGTSAIYSSYRINYSAKSNDCRGMLLFGGYKWDSMSLAEICQGHNSAFTDHKGRSFVVYHTRFNDGLDGHQVRIHQLFLNDEGWLMAAPYEFHGETINNDSIATYASVADSDIPGVYQFMRHQYCQDTKNLAFETPTTITLNADGSITDPSNTSNSSNSFYRTPGTDYITLTLSGVEYRGILVYQTIDNTSTRTLCIAACSSSSGSTAIGQSTFTYQQEIWCSRTGDAPTAIVSVPESPNSSLSPLSSNYFNLSGQRVSATFPGIIIHNGHKYIR